MSDTGVYAAAADEAKGGGDLRKLAPRAGLEPATQRLTGADRSFP